MPLIPQQDIIVVEGPYPVGGRDETSQVAAARKLRRILSEYAPVRIVSMTSSSNLHGHCLTVVVETI